MTTRIFWTWIFIALVLGAALGVLLDAQPSVYTLDTQVQVLTARFDALERNIYAILIVVVGNIFLSGLAMKRRPT